VLMRPSLSPTTIARRSVSTRWLLGKKEHSMSASTLRPEGPFSGLLIIDLTHVLAGPFRTNIFNDLGARVIKIAAGLGQMLGNVVIIGRADPVEQQSARALSLVSIAHTRVSHL
jgi:hypothetical protein